MCGPLRQSIDERGDRRMKHRRPGGPLRFQALIALDASGDVPDRFALFPDQGHAVDAPIALIEEGHIVDEAIGHRDLHKPIGPLAHAEHGEKLCARRRHRRHAHQPAEHDGHEPAPPRVLHTHSGVLPPPWFSSRSDPRRAGGSGPAHFTDTSRERSNTAHFSVPLAPNARGEPRLETEARHERTLSGVGSSAMFSGVWPTHPHSMAPHLNTASQGSMSRCLL